MVWEAGLGVSIMAAAEGAPRAALAAFDKDGGSAPGDVMKWEMWAACAAGSSIGQRQDTRRGRRSGCQTGQKM